MNKGLAIECIKTQMQFVDDMTKDAFKMAIKAIEGNCSKIPNNWVPCTPETMPYPNQNVIMQCRGKRYPSGYRYFQTIGCYIPPLTVKSEEKWNDGDSEDVEVYDENTDTYYCKEGWYEETTQGDGDCMSWYMNADVIAWMPTPEPYQPKEESDE